MQDWSEMLVWLNVTLKQYQKETERESAKIKRMVSQLISEITKCTAETCFHHQNPHSHQNSSEKRTKPNVKLTPITHLKEAPSQS